MCGIAGIINFNGKPVHQEELKRMTDVIAHRGPDGEGFWLNKSKTVGFGHRRLSIIDLTETGKQPMHYADGRYTIVYNGEIYNYVELKEELRRYGYQFHSSSDTEVLLALYDRKKEKCLDYLDGMFSFSIWDDKEQTLFAARDRFGEKPFFYFMDQSRFIFGSEIKALIKVESGIRVEKSIVQRYLDENYKGAGTETFFTKTQYLPAAHYLLIKDGQCTLHKYWEIDLYRRTRYVKTAQYYERFYELFNRSVTRRLRSDVNTGSSLSGGLDSSAVVCCVNKLSNKPFQTYSARFKNEIGDEGKWINEITQHTGIANFEVYPGLQGMMSNIHRLLFVHEFPIASASVYAQWCVMELARKNNTTVLLDGQGADEYLAGYDNLKYFAIWELYRKGHILQLRKEVQHLRENFGNQKSVGYKFLYDPVLDLLGKKRNIYNHGYTLRERLKYAVESELPELLRYADRNSMAHSVEVRLPFLSHQLVEYAFSLPPEQIYHNGKTKFVLREAVKEILPRSIYSRKDKIGFAPPQEKWILEPAFREEIDKAGHYLKNAGIRQSDNSFRNYIAYNFITAFS